MNSEKAKCLLTSDFSLDNYDFSPYVLKNTCIDGQGHKITITDKKLFDFIDENSQIVNLTINSTSVNDGFINECAGTIRNVSYIFSKKYYSYSSDTITRDNYCFINTLLNKGRIRNCNFSGEISGHSYKTVAETLADKADIIGCALINKISLGSEIVSSVSKISLVVGYISYICGLSNLNYGSIRNITSYNSLSKILSAINNKALYVGGLVGKNYGEINTCLNYWENDTENVVTYADPIVALNYSDYVNNCYSFSGDYKI